MRRLVPFLIILMLLSTSVTAINYQLDIVPVDDSILPSESAQFRLTIINFEKTPERFQVYTLDPNWVVRVNPPLTTAQPSTLQEHMLSIRPTSQVSYGTEGMTILVKHLESGVIQKQNLIIHVVDPNRQPGIFAPSVRLDLLIPDQIDPRQPLKIGVNLRNRNALDIKDMEVTLRSELFQERFTTDLEPAGEKGQELTFQLDPVQESGTYDLTAILTLNNKSVNEVKTSFTIASIIDIEEVPVDESFFFRSETAIAVTNKGNTLTNHQVKVPTSFLRSLFSSTEPATSTMKIGGERYYVWDVSLAPQERIDLHLVENYRFLILFILLALIGVVAYYAMRSPLIAVKETIALKEENEEGSSALKIRIFIKNRTGKQLDGVSVIDKVPGIARYLPKETLGMVSPTKVVKNEKRGTVLKWELDILEPYEERILTYNLVSRLSIVGKIKLPSAKIHFSNKGGTKERVTYTKNVSFEE